MWKKFIAIVTVSLVTFSFSLLDAQSGKVPPFRIIQSDGKIFKAEDLPLGKPIMIVYFSPECEECHELTEGILSRINDLRDVSIAMITYMPVEAVVQYVVNHKLKGYSNIYVGTEGNYLFVLRYYSIEKFPFIALFNKNGDLIIKYQGKEIDLKDLLYRVAKL